MVRVTIEQDKKEVVRYEGNIICGALQDDNGTQSILVGRGEPTLAILRTCLSIGKMIKNIVKDDYTKQLVADMAKNRIQDGIERDEETDELQCCEITPVKKEEAETDG